MEALALVDEQAALEPSLEDYGGGVQSMIFIS